MTELQPIIVFHDRHFVRHLGICNRICVKLLQLMCGVTAHNSVKKTGYQRRKFFEKCTSFSVKYTARFVGETLIWQILNNIKLLLKICV